MNEKVISTLKNPFTQAFGMLIRNARKREGKSSNELAKDLGIGGSLLRLIESGAATLQPNKSLDLIKALPGTRIEFRQLSVLLVCCAVCEARGMSPDEGEQVLLKLVELDHKLGRTIEPLIRAWPDLLAETDTRKRAERIEKLDIPSGLEEFLSLKTDSNEEGTTSTADQWGHKLITGTSPMHMDLLEDLLTHLNRTSPKPTLIAVKEWEKNHIKRFRRIYAVLETVRILPKTYEEFDWSLVYKPGLRIISMAQASQKGSEVRSFKQFMGKLQNDEKLQSLEENREMICELRFAYEADAFFEELALLKHNMQVRLPFVSSPESEAWKAIIAQEKPSDFKNAWIYEVGPKDEPHSGPSYHCAFIDDFDISSPSNIDSQPEVRVCSWHEVEKWSELLNNLWN